VLTYLRALRNYIIHAFLYFYTTHNENIPLFLRLYLFPYMVVIRNHYFVIIYARFLQFSTNMKIADATKPYFLAPSIILFI